ncbi:MAG: hypothetical protein Kow0099_17680 [Candidatus Abyssubacteria bacterium]
MFANWLLPKLLKNSVIELARTGKTDKLKNLLDNRVTGFVGINVKDNAGMTPLMHAAKQGHLDTVRLLLSRGADVRATTEVGWKASTLAEANGHPEITEVLKQAEEKSEISPPPDKDKRKEYLTALRQRQALIVAISTPLAALVSIALRLAGWDNPLRVLFAVAVVTIPLSIYLMERHLWNASCRPSAQREAQSASSSAIASISSGIFSRE